MFKTRLASAAVLCMLLAACDTAISDYRQLCEIYEEVESLEINELEKIHRIGSRVQEEIPNVYRHYRELSQAAPDEVYRLTKEVAEYETGEEWECPIMKSVYSMNAD